MLQIHTHHKNNMLLLLVWDQVCRMKMGDNGESLAGRSVAMILPNQACEPLYQ